MSDSSSTVSTNPARSSSVPDTGDLRGRVALVTGVGRRRGIGSAVCLALASRGADVVLSYWKAYDREMPWASDEGEPEALLGELRAAGVRAEGIEMDLSRSDSARLLLDATEESLGKPSILVNTAAYSTRDGFEALIALDKLHLNNRAQVVSYAIRNKIVEDWEVAGSPASGQRPGEGEIAGRMPIGGQIVVQVVKMKLIATVFPFTRSL